MSNDTTAHTVDIRVRYADTDKMNVANNGMYFTWFEVGRTEFLRDCGMTYKDVENRGYLLPLRETGIKYLKPARYDDVLTVRTCVEEQKGVRLRFSYELSRGDELLAIGFTEHVFTNESLRPVKPPKELSDVMSVVTKRKASQKRNEVLA